MWSPVNAGAADRGWHIQLEGMFPKARQGPGPLNIYARDHDGKWIAAVGSNRLPQGNNHYAFNTSYWYVDLSKAPVVDNALKGEVTIHVTPDLWVPASHRGFTISLNVDAKLGADNKLSGKYAVARLTCDDATAASFAKEGSISGNCSPGGPMKLPDPVTFNLNFQGALIGGKPDLKERCMVVRLAFRDGKLGAVSHGAMSLKKEAGGMAALPLPEDAITADGDYIKGKVVIPTKTLDLTPVEYTFEFQGCIVANWVAGTYKMTAKQPDLADIVIEGSFDGRFAQGYDAVKQDDRPWYTAVKGFEPVKAGEHPRLMFRKSDVPALRKQAETPEGKALIARLKAQLGGGEAMPKQRQGSSAAYSKDSTKLGLGAYTFSHAAGFGFLYQLTGEKKYADLALECFEWAFKGIRDRDDRYSWVKPGGALRAGVVLGWYALGYDLACEGWDDATRQRIAKAIAEYNAGTEEGDAKANLDVETLIRGTQPPGSNHYGMQVGGVALALLAVMKDPGVDQAKIDKLLQLAETAMARNMTEGFGDGAFFAEGDGTGSMSSQHNFTTALHAWRVAMGRDYVNVERPNARALAWRWIYQTVVRGGRPDFWPIRGAYGHNVWDRDGGSGGGYFCLNMAVLPDEQKAGMKWYYNHYLAAQDAKEGAPFDSVNTYPHCTIAAFVNWPWSIQEKNPAQVLPLGFRDSIQGFYCWRNRWQDENDVVITILTADTRGNYKCGAESALKIATGGARENKFDWGKSSGPVKAFAASPHWDTSVVTRADGTSIAIDFTKSSGADVMLVTTGTAEGDTVTLGSAKLTFKFIGGAAPKISVEGDKAVAGKQTVWLKDGQLVLGTTSAP
jgi:hypothetical protein